MDSIDMQGQGFLESSSSQIFFSSSRGDTERHRFEGEDSELGVMPLESCPNHEHIALQPREEACSH